MSRPPIINPKDYLKYTQQSQRTHLAAGDPQAIHPEAASQYDKGFTVPEYDPYGALNELRAQRQTALDKFGNGLANMGTSAFTGGLESTVGALYGMGSALVNWDEDKLWKNAFTDTIIDPLNEWTKENAPFYYSKAEQDASVLGGMGYQNFWFDKVMGGAGYTIGSLAAGYGLNSLFGMSKAAAAGKLLSDAASGERALTNGLQLSREIKDVMDMGKQFTLGLTMAHGESALEARQTYEEGLRNGMTPEQATDAANSNYLLNLAMTGPVDMLFLNKWVNPGTKQAAKEYNKIARVVDEAGKVTLKDATLENAKRGYLNLGKKFLEGFSAESAQEFGQFASNIASQEFVKNYNIKNKDWLSSIIDGLATGIEEGLTSKEGLESALVGGIVGGPFGTKGAKSERLAREAATEKRIKGLMTDPDFLQGGSKMANYILANNALNASEEAKKNNDLFEANNQEATAFGKYVQAHIESETVDLLKEKLETLKQAPDADFRTYFGFKESDTIDKAQVIDKLVNRVDRLTNIHDNLTRVYGISSGTPEELAQNKWLRNQLFEASFTLDNIEERETNMSKALTDLTRNPGLAVAWKNLLNSYKTKDTDVISEEMAKWEEQKTKALKMETKLTKLPTYEEFRKQARDTYRKEYNDVVNKVIADNPVIADEITELLVDLNKNAERREKVIQYLNALKDPKQRDKVKQDFDKAIFKEIAESIKATNALAGTTPPTTTTSEEDAANIIQPSKEAKQKFVQTPAGQQVDVGNMSIEELEKLRETVIEEMSGLDPASVEFQGKKGFAVQLEEELNLRTNGDAILKDLRRRYREAKTFEDKRKIIEEAASKGFPINLEAYEKDRQKSAQTTAPVQAKEEVKIVDNNLGTLFKGTNEFKEVVRYTTVKDGEVGAVAEEAFEKLIADPDFKDKLTVEVSKGKPAGVIAYGTGDKAHPTLGKQRSDYNIIIKYEGTPIGFITFYDTFIDKVTGATINIPTLTLNEFKEKFNPTGTAGQLEEFKKAYEDAMMFHKHITSDKFLKGRSYATIPNGELLDFVFPTLTSGTFVKVAADEDFVPLSEFTLYRDSKGNPTIVDTSKDAVRLSNLNDGGVDTYETSNTEAYKSSGNFAPDGTPAKPEVNPDLVNAFTMLSNMKKDKKAYSRYWALVESPGGPIKIGEKQFRWTPLTPSAPYSKADELVEALNKALDNDPSGSAERGVVKKDLNEGLFIAFGDNGNYSSNFRVDIQPEYGFTDKEGREYKEGYALKIYSPSFFRNKEEFGETNGIKWKIKDGSLYLTIRGRVETFETMVDRFEAMRQKLADAGGPLVGTTPITTSNFKDNPVTSSQTLRNVKDLEFKLASTTKPKTADQRLILNFNREELIKATPGVLQPRPAVLEVPVTQAPQTPKVKDVIGDDVYTKFIDTNEVPETIVNSIASKIKGGVALSPREVAIYQAKGSDIEAVRKKLGTTVTKPIQAASELEAQKAEMLRLLGTTPTQPSAAPVSDKKADIERRRNEELDKLELKYVSEDYRIAQQQQTSDKGKSLGEAINRNIKEKDSINAKYDAELAALEGALVITSTPAGTPGPVSALEQQRLEMLKLLQGDPTADPVTAMFGPPTTIDTEVADVVERQQEELNVTEVPAATPTQAAEELMGIQAAAEAAEKATGIPQKPHNFDQKPPSNLPAWSRSNSTVLSESERINVQAAFAELRKILPDWISMEELDALETNIANGIITLGYFKNNVIKLASIATVGTQYHEAFHAVFRTMLTSAEQRIQYDIAKEELRKELQKQGKSFNKHRDEFLAITPEAKALQDSVIDLLILEEYMADKFKDYMNTRKTTSKLRKFFEKILRFFRLVKTNPMDELFAKIEKGDFKKATRIVSRFDSPIFNGAPANKAIFLRNDTIDGKQLPVYLNSQLQLNEVNKIASMVLTIIDNQTKDSDNKDEELDAFDNDSVNTIIDKILNDYATNLFSPETTDINGALTIYGNILTSGNTQAIKKFEDMMYLYNNKASRDQFKEELFKTLNKFNVTENSDFTVEDSEISDTSPERNYERTSENIGGPGSLSKFMRKYIATTTYEVSLNDFFNTDIEALDNFRPITIAVDSSKVYNGLTKLAQNQLDINDVLNVMADQLENSNEMTHFISKFFQDANIGITSDGKADLSQVFPHKKNLVQQVAKAFNLFSVNYKFSSFDPENRLTETIDANRRNVDSDQVNSWSKNFAASKYPAETMALGIQNAIDYLSADPQMVEQGFTKLELMDRTRIIQQNLRLSGIELSSGYIKYLILSNPDLKVRTEAQETKLDLYNVTTKFNDVIKNLQIFQTEILKSTPDKLSNPFERVVTKKETGGKVTKEETGSVTRALSIAKDNAIFDESVSPPSFTNGAGKIIYGLQTDTYHMRKILEIATSEDWSLEVLQAKAKEDPIAAFLASNYLLNSKQFNLIKDTIRLERIDAIRERSISYNEDSKENKIDIAKRQTEGVTFADMSDREFAMMPYIYYANNKKSETLIREGEVISKRPIILNVMETASTSDAVSLPIIDAVNLETGKINDSYLEAMYNQLAAEHARIKMVQDGKIADKYLNFNYGPKQRGGQFWADNKAILEEIYGDQAAEKIEQLIESDSLEGFKTELKQGIEKWLESEVDAHIDELISLGILQKSKEGNLENLLLPKGFSELLAANNPNRIFPTGNLRTNIKQAYLSNALNTLAANQLLSGDPAIGLKDFADKGKRDKGNNASGMNTTKVTFPGESQEQTFNYGVYVTKEFDEIKSRRYALSNTKIIKVYQDGKPETPENYTEEFKEFSKDLSTDDLNKALEDGEIPVADAQGHGTLTLFKEIYESFGRMKDRGYEIYKKIENGEDLTFSDQKYLKDNQIMLNSLKMVYYDGHTYIKLSIAPLTKSMTSYKNSKGEWVAQKGLEWEHDMRTKMENTKMHLIGPVSMSKKATKNPIVLTDDNNLPDEEILKKSINVLDKKYFKLQQENPSNKTEGKDPTQMLQVLSAEQDPNTIVNLPDGTTATVGQIVKEYREILGDRVFEASKYALAYITEFKKSGKSPIKLKRLIGVFKDVLMQTGASEKLLNILETDQNGDPIYDINLPEVVTKFEEMFNAHFNKVFNQKIPGYKTTLQSDLNHNIIYEKATGKIITRGAYKADPEKYNTDAYGTRRLEFDKPRIINGKEVGRYSEIILPFHFAAQFNLKPGDEIPEEIAYLFGVRIPSQDKHSAMSLKIVDILPPEYGSNAIFPEELIILTGSDFDIDSFYIHRPGHYIKKNEDGTPRFMVYGNKEDSDFEQHMIWHKENNIFVKSIVKADKKADSPLANEYKEVKSRFDAKKAELAEKYKKKQAILDYLDNPADIVLPLITGRQAIKLTAAEIQEVKTAIEPLKEALDVLEDKFIVAAMRELNIPTTEAELRKSDAKNIGVLNNKLLDYKIALHTNAHINKEVAKTPASLRTVRDEIIPQLMTYLGYDKKGDSYGRKVVTFVQSGLMKAFSAFKAGGAAIGAAVNATQTYSVFSKYGLPKLPKLFINEEGKKVALPFTEIDGVKMEGISNTTFLSNPGKSAVALATRIMDVLSTFTSSMTDNGKWLFNRKLNVDLETLGVVTYAVQQRVPALHMAYMINNEYVIRFIKLNKKHAIQTIIDGKTEDERAFAAKEELIQTLEEKLKKEFPDINFTALALEPITLEELTEFLPYSSNSKNYVTSKNKAQFYEILEQSEKGGAFLKSQYKLLITYRKLLNEQQFINNFTRVLSLTKGIVGAENDRSFSADDSLVDALTTLNIKMTDVNGKIYFTHINPKKVEMGTIPFDVLPIIQNDPLIRANLELFYKKQQVAKEVFISKTKLAEDTGVLVYDNISNRTTSVIKRKTMRAFRRNFESYFNTLAFREWAKKNNITLPSFSKLLFKDLDKSQTSLQNKIADFRKANPQFNTNLFFRLLQGDINEKTSFENLGHNTRSKSNAGFESRIIEDYDAIFNHSPEGRALANELFFYQMARYGLQYKSNSYIGSIAAHRFQVVATNIKEMLPLFNTLEPAAFEEMFGVSKVKAIHNFMKRFFSDVNNSRSLRVIADAAIKRYTYTDAEGNLVFPTINESLVNQKTGNFYTMEEATKLRNERHDYLGAVETEDGNRSTVFPYTLRIKRKVNGRTEYTLFRLDTLNGKSIENIDLLTELSKDNGGKMNGASATYVPVNYTGSSLSNNSFLPYALTDEELNETVQHIQDTVGKNAKKDEVTSDEAVDEFEPMLADTSSSTDLLAMQEMIGARAEVATGLPAAKFAVQVITRYTDADVKANPNKIYVFGDNVQRVGTGGQAQIRNNPNAMGIATKLAPSMSESAFMSDKDLTTNKAIIDADISKIKATGKPVVLPKDGLGTGLAKLKEKAPQTYAYLKERLLQEFGFNNDTGVIEPIEPVSTTTSTQVLSNAQPLASTKVIDDVQTKAVVSIAEIKMKLQDHYIVTFAGSPVEMIKGIQALEKMSDSELVNEYNKILKC